MAQKKVAQHHHILQFPTAKHCPESEPKSPFLRTNARVLSMMTNRNLLALSVENLPTNQSGTICWSSNGTRLRYETQFGANGEIEALLLGETILRIVTQDGQRLIVCACCDQPTPVLRWCLAMEDDICRCGRGVMANEREHLSYNIYEDKPKKTRQRKGTELPPVA